MAPRTMLRTLLVCTLLVLSSITAAGQERSASALKIEPAHPAPGSTVSVSYRPVAAFEGESSLVLRGELHLAGEMPRVEPLATLLPSDDGSFRTTFDLPEALLYAVLAVEDLDGAYVDHHDGAWEILASNAQGVPLASALELKVYGVRRRDSRLAQDAARTNMRLHPDSLSAWASLYWAESNGSGEMTRSEAEHHTHLREFSESFTRRNEVSAYDMAKLVFYANWLDESEIADLWTRRLIARHPGSRHARQQQVFAASDAYPEDLAARMREFERLWHQPGEPSPQLPFSAFGVAGRMGHDSLLVRWGGRLAETNPEMRGTVSRAWLNDPDTRLLGIRSARRYMEQRRASAVFPRDLFMDVPEYQAKVRSGIALWKSFVGEAQLEQGDTAHALKNLEEAVDLGWRPDIFRKVAALRLALGDTAGAVVPLARLAADPESPAAFADSAFVSVAGAVSAETWATLVDEARQRLHVHIEGQLVERKAPAHAELLEPSGRVRMVALQSDVPTVIALWSRYCRPSLMQLDQLEQTADALAHHGVRLISVTAEAPSESLSEFLDRVAFQFPVFLDPDHALVSVLGQPGTPTYLVLDAHGMVRFQTRSPSQLVRQASYLTASVNSDHPEP